MSAPYGGFSPVTCAPASDSRAIARLPEPVRGPRLEEMKVLRLRRIPLAERRDVVEDEHASAMRSDDEIVERRLHLHPVDRRRWQVVT